MLKIYGTNTCPDCVEAKANFDFYKIEYAYIDVCESVRTLKQFLQIRDNAPIYETVKKNGSVGIPTIILDDQTITLDWESVIRQLGSKIIHISAGKTCGIDGKGC